MYAVNNGRIHLRNAMGRMVCCPHDYIVDEATAEELAARLPLCGNCFPRTVAAARLVQNDRGPGAVVGPATQTRG